MAKDPYSLLGVQKTASDAEIKKAYRQLAKKLHPDANPGDPKAADRFKEITAAYTLLSDKDLRARFDSGEVDASGQQQNPFAGGGFDPRRYQNQQFEGVGNFDDMSDLFASLFGMNVSGMGAERMYAGGVDRGNMRGGAYNPRQKGADVKYRLSLSFLDAVRGGTKRIRMANGANLDVKIPEGVEHGQTLRLRGKGQSGQYGGPPGDAHVHIEIKPHKYYSRDGNTLKLNLPISVQEAILGANVRLTLPSGDLTLKIPPHTNTGQTFRLKGKGIKGGDLLATVQIILSDPHDAGLKVWAEAQNSTSSPKIRSELT